MVKTSPSSAGGAGSVSGQEAKIPQASWPENQNMARKQQKQYCNTFNKDFRNGSHQKKKKTLTKKAQCATKYLQFLCHTSVNLGVT